MDFKGIDTKQQVLAEASRFDHAFEIPVGCAHDPGIDVDDLIVTNASQVAAFEHSEQLGLHGQGQLADLIQEDRSPVGGLEEPLSLYIGSGESTFDVPKEFAFDQVFWQRSAIDRNEGFVAPQTFFMHGASHKLLATTRLTSDQNRAVGRCNSGNEFGNTLHRFGLADDLRCAGRVAAFHSLELRRALLEPTSLRDASQELIEFGKATGLAQIIDHSKSQRRDGRFQRTLSR